MVSNEELLVALRRAACDLATRRTIRDVQATLAHIVRSAVDTVPQVEAGGVSIIENGRITSREPTSDAVAELDKVQSELGEGPCVSAISDPPDDGIVIVHDLDGDDAARWPTFAPKAVESGVRSMMSAVLSLSTDAHAALNLYASTPGVFDADARMIAGLFGVQASMLLYGAESASALQRALETRDLIGQAKGILMHRFGIDADSAFQMLVSSSQDTNLKLVHVAQWLVDEVATHR